MKTPSARVASVSMCVLFLRHFAARSLHNNFAPNCHGGVFQLCYYCACLLCPSSLLSRDGYTILSLAYVYLVAKILTSLVQITQGKLLTLREKPVEPAHPIGSVLRNDVIELANQSAVFPPPSGRRISGLNGMCIFKIL